MKIAGSGSTPKCHGSATLQRTIRKKIVLKSIWKRFIPPSNTVLYRLRHMDQRKPVREYGSEDPCQNFKDPQKQCSGSMTFGVEVMSFFKDKKSRKVTKWKESWFFLLLKIEGSGAGSIPRTSGSGSGRLKNM